MTKHAKDLIESLLIGSGLYAVLWAFIFLGWFQIKTQLLIAQQVPGGRVPDDLPMFFLVLFFIALGGTVIFLCFLFFRIKDFYKNKHRNVEPHGLIAVAPPEF